jgi:ABC-type lipoprotein export system ATPase subunit
MKSCLSANDVIKEFKTADSCVQILEGITVEFQQGTRYAIMGVSGVGKSTFMHLLAGLEKPTRGHISFDGASISSFSESARMAYLQTSVGLVFQTPYLIRELSVLENVMLPGMVSGQNKEVSLVRAQQLLDAVGLKSKIKSKPGTLSIGQQQRVALCRALFNKPAFLLADEPTGALDEKTGKAIIDLLFELQQTTGMGIVISTHDQYVAQAMDVIYEIEGGKLVRKK